MTDVNFLEDARAEVLTGLPHDRNNPALVAELNALPLPQLLLVYLNWRRRLIRPVPRHVHVSQELQARRLTGRRARVVAEILRALKNGGDLTHRLSESIVRDGYSHRSSSKTRDKDWLLTDWGIHHLHLGSARSGVKEFCRRTKALLFVAIRPEDAYVIDLLDHSTFDDVRLIEIVVRNWPHAGLAYALSGVTLGQMPSQAERRVLRKVGIVSPVMVDGLAYIVSPITTAGTTVADANDTANLIRLICDIERRVRDDPGYVVELVRKAGIAYPVTPARPRFAFFGNGAYGIYDAANDVGIGLGYF